jgi:hypothetical protein
VGDSLGSAKLTDCAVVMPERHQGGDVAGIELEGLFESLPLLLASSLVGVVAREQPVVSRNRRLNGEQQVDVLLGLGRPALGKEHDRHGVVGLGKVRLECDGSLSLVTGRVEAPDVDQAMSEQGVGLGEVWLDRQHPTQGVDRRIGAANLEKAPGCRKLSINERVAHRSVLRPG